MPNPLCYNPNPHTNYMNYNEFSDLFLFDLLIASFSKFLLVKFSVLLEKIENSSIQWFIPYILATSRAGLG